MSRTSRRLRAVLTGMLGVAAVSSAAKAGPDAPAKEIARLENLYSQGFVSGDTRVAERLLTDDFIGFGSSGKPTDKAAMLAEVRRLPHQASSKITSIVVRLHGSVAVAMGTEDDTSPGSMEISHREWLDTWRHTPQGWRMVASAEIEPKR